jgi:hypothetical protein
MDEARTSNSATHAQKTKSAVVVVGYMAPCPISPPSLLTIGYEKAIARPLSEFSAAIEDAKLHLQPIDLKQLAVELDRTLGLWTLPANWDEVAPYYVEALAEFPADLVQKALQHARFNRTFFPKPAELRQPILDEMEQRKSWVKQLERFRRTKIGRIEQKYELVHTDRDAYRRSPEEIRALVERDPDYLA